MTSDPFWIGSWPALLTLELACRYLCLESNHFLALVEKWKVYPVEVDDAGARWRLRDLDRLIRHLPTLNETPILPTRQQQISLDQNAVVHIARAVSDRLDASGKPSLYSIKDAAHQLGLGRSTIYKMISEGMLSVRRIGKRTLVTQESITSLLE